MQYIGNAIEDIGLKAARKAAELREEMRGAAVLARKAQREAGELLYICQYVGIVVVVVGPGVEVAEVVVVCLLIYVYIYICAEIELEKAAAVKRKQKADQERLFR